MAGPNDVFLRTPASANNVQLKDQTLPDGGTVYTINGALTQAAATQAGALTERFIVNGALAQAASVLAGVLTERYGLAGAMTQAKATMSGTLTERFILNGAATQAAAALSGTLGQRFKVNGALTQAAAVQAGQLLERFIIAAAVAQAAAAQSGTLRERFILDAQVTQAAAAFAGQLTVVAGVITINGALVQGAATIAGVLDNPSVQPPEVQRGGGPFIDHRQMAPVRRHDARILVDPTKVYAMRMMAGHLTQAPSVVAGRLTYSDDELVLALTA